LIPTNRQSIVRPRLGPDRAFAVTGQLMVDILNKSRRKWSGGLFQRRINCGRRWEDVGVAAAAPAIWLPMNIGLGDRKTMKRMRHKTSPDQCLWTLEGGKYFQWKRSGLMLDRTLDI